MSFDLVAINHELPTAPGAQTRRSLDLETESFEKARAGMAEREVNERWQREMKDFFVQSAGLLPDSDRERS